MRTAGEAVPVAALEGYTAEVRRLLSGFPAVERRRLGRTLTLIEIEADELSREEASSGPDVSLET